MVQTAHEILFQQIYLDNLYKLQHYAYNYLYDEDMAKSVVHDAFLKVWEKRETIDWNADVRVYLHVIVKNRCLDLIRQKLSGRRYSSYSKEKMLELNRDALYHISSINLYHKEVVVLLKKSLEDMPDTVREVYLLSKVDLMKNREISAKLNVSVSTVESRLTKAYKILRANLKDYLIFLIWYLLRITFIK